MKTFTILISLLVSTFTFGQDNFTYLKNWKTYPVPTNKDTIMMHSASDNHWFIYADQDEIKVEDIKTYNKKPSVELPFKIKQSNSKRVNLSGPLAGLIDVCIVDNGYLVGFNRGEWGGELYWFSKDGSDRYEISGHQIVQFIERDNKIYAIEGSFLYGSIIEIIKKEGKWIAQELFKLAAPKAIQLDSRGNLIIITSGNTVEKEKGDEFIKPVTSKLFSVDRKFNIDTLVKVGIWSFMYVTSMIIKDDIVYVGMRKGVYKYDLELKKDEWLLPDPENIDNINLHKGLATQKK